jgi:2-desacetyl-2-hydroxyethyl bacteriochlorophyllide A dehydrogenase
MSNRSTMLVFTARERVGYEEIDLGDVGPRQVLVRTVASGISHGTEMAGFMGTSPFVKRNFADRVFSDRTASDAPFYPYRYAGYSAIGVIDQVGADVTRFKRGDRVWLFSPHQTKILADADREDLLKLAPGLSDDQAEMIPLTGVAHGAVVDAQIKARDAVVIFGAGAVGLLAAQIAAVHGASRVFVVEPLAERRASLESRGLIPIDPRANENAALQIRRMNDGRPPDVVIECSGTIPGLQGAIQAAGIAGTVIAAGFYQGGAGALQLGEEFLHNRVTIKASMWVWGNPSRFPERWDRQRQLVESLRLIESNQLDVRGWVTDRVPFKEGQRAYEMIRDAPGKHGKIMFTYE